jgi:hypothetical protein
MIRIFAIEREYGSGAAAIAEKLAARLGWKLWHQLLTEEIARLALCERSAVAKREERRDPLYYRLLKSFARGSYEGSRGAPVEMLGVRSISYGIGKMRCASFFRFRRQTSRNCSA